MSHYAHIKNGIVDNVIVAEIDFIATLPQDDGIWVKTSYNTLAGEHRLGGTPLRKNFAGIGYTYDAGRDAFIPPKPFSSWLLNEDTCQWYPPIKSPADGNMYEWDEATVSWVIR